MSYKIDMTDTPSYKGRTKYNVGDLVLYSHHSISGRNRVGEIVWKNKVDKDRVEYQVHNFPVLLWEEEINEVISSTTFTLEEIDFLLEQGFIPKVHHSYLYAFQKIFPNVILDIRKWSDSKNYRLSVIYDYSNKTSRVISFNGDGEYPEEFDTIRYVNDLVNVEDYFRDLIKTMIEELKEYIRDLRRCRI